jgi:acyl dehydratase
MIRLMKRAFFEDLPVGFIASAQGYTITEAEILEFGRRFDPQPFHTDPEAAKASIFGGLVAPGCLVMCARSWLVNQMDTVPAYAAGLGTDSLNLHLPVRAGDTLRLESEVIEARVSRSRPNCGVVKTKNRLYNQRDELVMELSPKMLVYKKDCG